MKVLGCTDFPLDRQYSRNPKGTDTRKIPRYPCKRHDRETCLVVHIHLYLHSENLIVAMRINQYTFTMYNMYVDFTIIKKFGVSVHAYIYNNIRNFVSTIMIDTSILSITPYFYIYVHLISRHAKCDTQWLYFYVIFSLSGHDSRGRRRVRRDNFKEHFYGGERYHDKLVVSA